MDKGFYFDVLYPFQDRVLGILGRIDNGFYLTGGTAASRGYLQHRFSDDLDLFCNDQGDFTLWADRLVQALQREPGWRTEISLREARFIRLTVQEGDVRLKVEMVNDVPSHIGEIRSHSVLGRIDSPENILANKITALVDREEPKDLADIWGFCCRLGLPLRAALEGASSKAAGIFPVDVARRLCTVTRADWSLVLWIERPDPEQFVRELTELGETLLLI
jgi:hypothetical protein